MTFEALQLLKSAYRQGHISAMVQDDLASPQNIPSIVVE
jgi:hypothetical protein